MRLGSLFAGIGGFDLAARWMGWETIWFSEIDPYCQAVLAKHWPGVPQLGDITLIDWSTVERPDMLVGGFPCQDISNAGKRAGIQGERSGLWREYARAIRELRPRYVVVENVAALLGRGIGDVLGDLATFGYDAEWDCIPAAAVGAPHIRDRVWVLAYPRREPGRFWQSQFQDGRKLVLPERTNGVSPERVKDWELIEMVPGIDRRVSADWWRAQSRVDRSINGLPGELDTNRARNQGCGNAIVPQCALEIFRTIQASEAQGGL